MKPDQHRLTYRVRRIPSTWTVEDLKTALLEGLGITDDTQIRVRVLATDLIRFNRDECRTAVVSFGLEGRPFAPRFTLQGSGTKLDCDTVFDDFTPLSSCDGDEHHNVEYVSPVLDFSMFSFLPEQDPAWSGSERCALLALRSHRPIGAEAVLRLSSSTDKFLQLHPNPGLGRPSNWFFHGRRLALPVDPRRTGKGLSPFAGLDIWLWNEFDEAELGRGCLRIR